MKPNYRVDWSFDDMGSVYDHAGNLHFWRAAHQDPFNKRLILGTVEHCGDYAHIKTTFCITRIKSSEPKITTVGPLLVPQEVIELVASDVISAFKG